MRRLRWLFFVLLAGCVSNGASLRPGVDNAPAVRAEMGRPAEVVGAPGGGEYWFYPRGREARETYRVAIGPDGRFRDVEQVLYEENFDRIVDGKSTREDVRRLIGPPNVEWRAMNGWETNWEYRYWWGGQPWLLTVGLDQKGVVSGQSRTTEHFTPGGERQ